MTQAKRSQIAKRDTKADPETIEQIVQKLRSGQITVEQANEMVARLRSRLDVIERVVEALVD